MINETFIRLLNETLNRELSISLSQKRVLVNQGTSFTFDLIDQTTSTFVIVFEEMLTIKRDEIKTKINSYKRLVGTISTKKALPNFYIICQNIIHQKEIDFYEKEFIADDGIRYHFLDLTKVIELAINNEIEIPNEFIEKSLIYTQSKSSNKQKSNLDLGNVYDTDYKKIVDDNIDTVKQSFLIDKLYKKDQNHFWLNLDFSKYKQEASLTGFALNYPIPSDQIELFNQLQKGDYIIGYDRELNFVKCLFVYIENDNEILPKFSLFKVLYQFEKKLSWKNLQSNVLNKHRTLRLGDYNSKLNKIEESLLIEVIEKCTSNFYSLVKQLDSKTLLKFSKNNVLNPLSPLSNQSFITPILKDTPHGTDYLDIKYDVAAFSKVLCMKDLPTPLSIALFGEWGSGKSFFMRSLKEEIEKHSDEKNPFYCNNIIHIEFNAWSYLDANLWASLASIIFEAIYDKLNDTNNEKEAVNLEVKKITNQISFVEHEKELIKHKIQSFELKLDEIQHLKETKKEQLSQLEIELSNRSEQTIVKTILQELKVKETIDVALKSSNLEDLSELNIETKNQVENLVKEVNKLPFTFKAIFSTRTYLFLIFIFAIIAALICFGFCFDLDYLNQKLLIFPEVLLGIISFASPILIRINTLIKKVQPVLKKVNELNKQVQTNYAQKVATSKLEIESLNTQILTIRREIEFHHQEQISLELEKKQLEKRLDTDLFSEAFKTRINHIISTNKYHDHLGLVSQLRKDFELLSNLFVKQISSDAISTDENDADLNQPIQRIILYIDDLDRCSEDIVIAVLEAVNLLLAFPLFVVVVGVDHRWVKNALINKHYKQFGIKENVPEYERIEPSSYLEKIFQIPFHLKKASSVSVKKMIEELIKSDLSNESIEPTVETEKPKRGKKRKVQPDQKPSESTEIKEPIMGGTTESDSAVLIETTEKKALNSTEELLQLTDYEKHLLPEFEFILGSNPRTIKRFVNIYRIVRAHAELPGGQNKDEENLICMFLVALAVGEHKSIFQKLNNFWKDKNRNIDTLEMLLSQNNEIEKNLRYHIYENDILKKLLEFNNPKYREISSFVSRFSFRYEIKEPKKETETEKKQ